MRNSTNTISMKFLRRRRGLQTKNRIKSYEKIYSIAHEGQEKQLQGLEASQRLSQGGDLGRGLSFFPLQVSEGVQAPLCLSTGPEKSAFGAGFRGQQKSKSRLLKTVAHPRAQALKLLKKGHLGIGMLQGIGDTMAHIADPRCPSGGLTEGINDAFLASGAAVAHHVRGPPTALEKREENRVDPLPVPCLAQAQAKDLNLLQRQRSAHAEGRDGDPQHDEGLLTPALHRTIGATHPRLIEGALSLWQALETET
jgi:hypothetical protein